MHGSGGAAAVAAPLPPFEGPLLPTSSLSDVPREQLRLFGNAVPSTVIYSVAFGSVKRKKDYVLTTIGEMLGMNGETSLSDDERKMVVIVAHLADFNEEWVASVAETLRTKYSDLVDKGHFHALHAPQELYPPLQICPPLCTWHDDPVRVKWRSKQNIDYAFLMHYAIPLAPFYLQIEDDLGFASNWINKMHRYRLDKFPPTFRNADRVPWRLLDFSELGFIGKLFQSDVLVTMAQVLVLFYDQIPCDLLLNDWMIAMHQKKRIDYWKNSKSLFRHEGVFRSLGGYQPLQEKKFGKSLWDNPAATMGTNMQIVPTYTGQWVYFSGGDPQKRNDKCDYTKSQAHKNVKSHRCWFWGAQVKAEDYFEMVFTSSDGVHLKGILYEHGHPFHPKDLFYHGMMRVAAAPCRQFFDVAPIPANETLVYWEEGTSDPPQLPVQKVKCLRFVSLQPQDYNIVIQMVQIRTQ